MQIPLLLEFTIIYIKRRGEWFCKCDVTYSKRKKYFEFKNKKTHDQELTPYCELIIIAGEIISIYMSILNRWYVETGNIVILTIYVIIMFS